MLGSLHASRGRVSLGLQGAWAISVFACAVVLASVCGRSVCGQESGVAVPENTRNVLIELYVRDGQPESDAALAAVSKIAESRPGLQVVKRTVSDNPDAQARLKAIADFFHFDPGQTPVVYGCGRAIRTGASIDEFQSQVIDMLRLEVFTQVGCPHCDTAHAYLNELAKLYPGLEVVFRSITDNPAARADLDRLSRELHTAVPETPVFHLCNQLMVGFDPAHMSGDHLREILKKWTIDRTPEAARANRNADQEPSSSGVHRLTTIQ